MSNYIDKTNLGTFESIEALWAAHPDGGHEGDYCYISGIKYRWNKYDRMWENAGTYTATPGRETKTFDGDVNIQNNLTVAGTLRAKRIKQPCLGLFSTEAALKAYWPDPAVGMYAVVGTESPFVIYRCEQDGVWTNTEEETTGFDPLDLTEINAAIAALQSEIFDYYDASWVGEGGTTTNFNALMTAIQAGKPIYYDGRFVYSLRRTSTRINLAVLNMKYLYVIDITNDDGTINIETISFTLADTSDVSNVGNRVTTLENWKATVLGPSGAGEVGYHNSDTSYSRYNNIKDVLDHIIELAPKRHWANWLEQGDSTTTQDHPERRLKVRYTSLVNTEDQNRLIQLGSIAACGFDYVEEESTIYLSFMTVGGVIRYAVTYDGSSDYCEVYKSLLPLPNYDASWIKGSNGTLDDYQALSAAIGEGVPIKLPVQGGWLHAIRASINLGHLNMTFCDGTYNYYYTVDWDTDHAVITSETRPVGEI